MSVAATFTGSTPDEVVVFLADQRQRMKPFRRVIVSADQTRVVDVNRNEVVFPGVTYGHPLLETVLRSAGASFDPTTFHTPPTGQPSLAARRVIPGRTSASCDGVGRSTQALKVSPAHFLTFAALHQGAPAEFIRRFPYFSPWWAPWAANLLLSQP